MTKIELVEQMAADAGITKVAAGKALESFIEGVTKALKKKDGKVTLVGFGTFSKVHRKARTVGLPPILNHEVMILRWKLLPRVN